MTIPVGEPVREAHGTRRRAWIAVASVVVLAALAVAGWFAWTGRDDDPVPPTPSPTATRFGQSGDHEVALVYADWLRGRQVAECFTAAGFPREPFLSDELERVPRVAQVLRVDPATSDPRLPTPELRWADVDGPGDLDSPPSRRLLDPEASDNCLPDAPVLRMAPGADGSDLAASARADEAFLAALAEYAWAAQNPGAVQLATARVADPPGVSRTDPTAQQAWEGIAGEAASILSGGAVVTGSETTDQYAQVAVLTLHGAGAVVRIALPEFDLEGTWSAHTKVHCGDVVLDIASMDHGGEQLVSGASGQALCRFLRALPETPGG